MVCRPGTMGGLAHVEVSRAAQEPNGLAGAVVPHDLQEADRVDPLPGLLCTKLLHANL